MDVCSEPNLTDAATEKNGCFQAQTTAFLCLIPIELSRRRTEFAWVPTSLNKAQKRSGPRMVREKQGSTVKNKSIFIN